MTDNELTNHVIATGFVSILASLAMLGRAFDEKLGASMAGLVVEYGNEMCDKLEGETPTLDGALND